MCAGRLPRHAESRQAARGLVDGTVGEQASGEVAALPGVRHSKFGLAHDRMHGGVKGRRMSKKDKLRAKHAAAVRGP